MSMEQFPTTDSKKRFPSWRVWLKTSRPFSLTASVSPVLVGTAVAAYEGVFHIVPFLLALFASLFLQIGTNYFNEYFDYSYGLDHPGSLGSMTVIFRNEMTEKQVQAGGVTCFVLAALLGLVGIVIAYFYSARPLKFASRGLGDILVYIAMGFLMTWGAYYVQIPQWSWRAFAASVPVGFLVTAILNMNNMRDYADDLAVQKRTLPVRFGQRFGQIFHAVLLIGCYVAVTIFALTGILPLFSLLVWITFPLAFSNVRSVLTATERRAFITGIKRTAMLHFQFGAVFALAIVLAIIHLP